MVRIGKIYRRTSKANRRNKTRFWQQAGYPTETLQNWSKTVLKWAAILTSIVTVQQHCFGQHDGHTVRIQADKERWPHKTHRIWPHSIWLCLLDEPTKRDLSVPRKKPHGEFNINQIETCSHCTPEMFASISDSYALVSQWSFLFYFIRVIWILCTL